ncbi:LamG-like jellyroll fold domain-containing protein [Microbacterium sp. 22215]|uniref:LamG-like jellyroll fold domain-containing protein n=1 Tax=Microbacterium sp. 22215 TaxID=3453893 RepID=UPI003F8462BD
MLIRHAHRPESARAHVTGGSMRARIFLGFVLVSILFVGGLTPSGAAVAQGATVGRISAPRVTAATDEAAVLAAQQVAVETGEPVVVDELTTPTELTTALPDGTTETAISSRPVRVEQDGSWVDPDLSLVRVGQWYEPAATAVPVRFSTGGSDQLSQVRAESGEWITEVWPHGTLPAPVIDGDTATYTEVLPGVDLKLVATRTGKASIFVVKNAAAAASSQLADLRVNVEGAMLDTNASGTAIAETDSGATVVAGQPLWWDSSGGGDFREPGLTAPVRPVEHEFSDDGVAMDVGESVEREVQDMPADGELDYPLFIDPDWSVGEASSWYTDAAYPDQSYLSAGASDVLRVGIYQNFRSDMFFQFPISAMSGKQILSARLNTTQVAVAACGVQPIQVQTYGLKTPGFTWDQEQAWNAAGTGGWSAILQAPFYGPDCGAAPLAVGWNVTAGVKDKVGDDNMQFAFTYSNPNAPSRRHYSRDATLIVTYNTAPRVPTAQAIVSPPRACGTAVAPAQVAATDVTVSVNQTDPDAGNVDTYFYLSKASATATVVQTKSAAMRAQGVRSIPFTGLTDGVTYAWRARGYDTHAWGAYGGWCYFTVDVTKPVLPTVSSTTTSFTVGQGATVDVNGETGAAGYVYWVAPGAIVSPAPTIPVGGTVSKTSALPACDGVVSASVRWACANTSGNAVLTVAPVDSYSTLWVSAYDRAGNQANAVGFPLYDNSANGAPAGAANIDGGHAWQLSALESPLPSTIQDSNPWIGANAVALTIPAGTATDQTSVVIPPVATPVLSGASLASTADAFSTSASPVDASKSFTLSMWVRPTAVPTADQVIASQGGTGRGSVSLRATVGGAYAFCITGAAASDDNGRPVSGCATGGSLSLNSWQMVTGIWDAGNQQLRLVMGGTSVSPVAAAGHVVGSGDWTANGPLKLAPAPHANRFKGSIADPVIVPGVVDHFQLQALAGLSLPFSE